MRKKLILLTFLCVSVMGWATQYCGNAVQSTVENTGISVNVTIEKIDATTTRIILDNEHIVSLRTGGCFQQWPGGVWKNNDNAPGVSNFAQGWSKDGTKWQKDFEWNTYPTTANIYFLMDLDESTSEPRGAGFTLTDIDMSASCSGGGSTPDSEGIDWNSVSFVPGSTQYKVGALSASDLPNNVVNIQKPGWAEEQGIYMTFPLADQLSCSVDAAISGTGMVVYLSNFQSSEETAVTVSWNGGSRTFYVYNNSLMTLPATKAASPAIAASNVRAVYSQYTLNTGMTRYTWSDGTTQNVIVDGRRFPSYKITNQLGLGIGRTNVSMMDKLHLDVWAESSFDINVCLISDGAGEHNQTVSLTGNQWNSVNLSLDDFQATKTAVTAIKLSGPSVQDQLFFLDNIYFYSESDLPDPDPTDVYDTNFALLSNGGIAYPSTNNGENFAAKAIDGDNGTQWESVQGSDPQTWTVDLGQRRIFNILQIRWEAAYARAFTISISNDAISWTKVAEETNYTTGGNDVEYQIELGENKTARYIRFNGTARATGYGYSFREFRVFLTGTPVLTSVGIASDKELVKGGEYATLTASPKDQNNSPIAADLSYSVSPSYLGHVTEGKYYPDKYGLATITVTADAGGVQVTNNVQIWGVTSTNLAKDNALSDDGTYTSDGGSEHLPAKAVDGLNNTWWQGSTNGEFGAADDEARTYDAYFTIDLGGIYNLQLVRIIFDGACSDKYKLKVSANNSDWADAYTYDQVTGNHPHTKYIATEDMNNSDNVRYLKFYSTKASTQWGVKIYELEVYGTEASNMKTVSASVNPASTGSVTVMAGDPLVAVTEVASGTPVTFTATPAEEYDFINWTQGGVEVSTSVEYVPTITSNTSLVANFELKRTPYCSTPVTDTQDRVLYLTISKTENENEYKILLEGSVNNKIVDNNVYVGTTLRLRNVNGVSEYLFNNAEGIWHVTAADEHSYGSAYVTFTATDFREISFVEKGIDLYRDMSGGGGNLSSFNAFPDPSTIKWDATCYDGAAPEMEAPTATAIGSKSVRLELQATDNMAALLQYKVNYKPTADEGDGETVYFNGTSGVQITPIISGLTTDIPYTFTVSVSDGTNESDTQTCSATPTLVAAPAPPARNSIYVRSIYSDAYTTILDADFSKTSFAPGDITCVEQDIAGNHVLIYDLGESNNASFAIGGLNPGDIFVAKEEYRGEYNTPDVSEMDYLHVDIWSYKATQYAELQINGVPAGSVALSGEGWQQFDLPLATFKDNEENLGHLKNLQHIKFVGLRDPNPEEIAIDNVYFYTVPEELSFADDATDNTDVIGINADKWANVTLNRNILADGTWYTLCLPFDMSAEKVNEVFGASTIAELASAEDHGSLISLKFDYVHAIEAGKAYLIKPGHNFVAGTVIQNVQIKNVAPIVSVAKEGETDLMHFQGTYNKITLWDSNIRFVAADNYLYSPSATGTVMGAFRCYFTIPTGSPASAPGKRARIVMGEQTATGVQNVQSHQVSYTKMLRDGQLLIIREGRMYNAQGMIVSE